MPKKYYRYEDLIDKTEYLVEGNMNHLRCKYELLFDPKLNTNSLLHSSNWGTCGSGPIWEVGRMNDRPITILAEWIVINGVNICVYNSYSPLVDWNLIDEALEKKFPNVKKTTVQNFFRVMSYIRAKQQENTQQEITVNLIDSN